MAVPDYVKRPSQNWAISSGFQVGVSVAILGQNRAVFQILNTDTNVSFPYVFVGGGLSLGMKFGSSLSMPGWTPFTTPSMAPGDFDSFGSVYGVEFTPVLGGGLTYVNIYSVDHAPNPLDCSGMCVGIVAGGGWTPGRFFLLESLHSYNTITASPREVNDALNARLRTGLVSRLVT